MKSSFCYLMITVKLTDNEWHHVLRHCVAVYGLQQLYAEWNKSTPDLGKNLAGWRQIPNLLEIGPLPEMPCPCYSESWQGVLCLRQLEPVDPGFFYQLYNVWIVGL